MKKTEQTKKHKYKVKDPVKKARNIRAEARRKLVSELLVKGVINVDALFENVRADGFICHRTDVEKDKSLITIGWRKARESNTAIALDLYEAQLWNIFEKQMGAKKFADAVKTQESIRKMNGQDKPEQGLPPKVILEFAEPEEIIGNPETENQTGTKD